jgi:hypothetical protein
MQFILFAFFGLAMTLPINAALAQGQPVDMGSHGPVWLMFIGTGILGLAIAYGIFRSRRRSPAQRQTTDNATKDLYRREEGNRRERNQT